MPGFVVSVTRASGNVEFYNVVCESDADAMRLVKETYGFANEAMAILRQLGEWEIACFNLDPMTAKRAA